MPSGEKIQLLIEALKHLKLRPQWQRMRSNSDAIDMFKKNPNRVLITGFTLIGTHLSGTITFNIAEYYFYYTEIIDGEYWGFAVPMSQIRFGEMLALQIQIVKQIKPRS